MERVWTVAISDLFSVTVTEEDKIEVPFSVSIEMAPEEAVVCSRLSVEAAVRVGFISALQCPFREASAKIVLEVESVREGKSTGGKRRGRGWGVWQEGGRGFTKSRRWRIHTGSATSTFHTGCIGGSVLEFDYYRNFILFFFFY